MASYNKTATGWRVRVRKNGQSISASFPTKALAQAWATREENDISAVIAGVVPDRTIAELFSEYAKKHPNESGTIARISAVIDTGKRIKALDASLLRSWQEKRLQSVSESTVLRERKIFNAAIRYGMNKLKWLKTNPFSELDYLKDGNPKTSVWTQEQIDRFCHAAGYVEGEMCITDTSRVAAALLFGLETAMRSAEILRARKEHISGRVLCIPFSKNGHARSVPLSLRALSLIEELPEVDVTLFSLTDASRDALFRKIRDRAGIKGVDFHSARRTALTRMAKIYDALTLAKISGHRDIRILLKHYYEPSMEELATRLDEV